jgi:hypothetical protein
MDMGKRFFVSEGTFKTANLATHHPIMSPLVYESKPLLMIFPRSIELETQSKLPGAPQVTVLAATSPAGVNESNESGIFSLLVAVEQGSIQGVNSPGSRGTRLVVAGDSDFLDDQVIDSLGNHDFAHLALSWLLQRPQILLTGLEPRPIKEYTLYVTDGQKQTLRWLFLGGLPGGVLLLGGLVWLRRRS